MPCDRKNRVILPQAKKSQRLPVNHQKLGERNGTDSLSKPSEGNNLANTFKLNF